MTCLKFFWSYGFGYGLRQRPKFFRAEHSATAEGGNWAYGPTLQSITGQQTSWIWMVKVSSYWCTFQLRCCGRNLDGLSLRTERAERFLPGQGMHLKNIPLNTWECFLLMLYYSYVICFHCIVWQDWQNKDLKCLHKKVCHWAGGLKDVMNFCA